jgi:hypothetical protein
VLICILWPWASRSVDWVNVYGALFNLLAYMYIAVPIFVRDEDLVPWWINDLGGMLLCSLSSIIALVYAGMCLIERLFDSIIKCMDSKGQASAAAHDIAGSCRAERKSLEVDQEESTDESTAAGDEEMVKAEFVHSPTISPRTTSPRSPSRTVKIAPPVLSPADLEAFSGEFPDVNTSDPRKKEEQLMKNAEELAMLRREKEIARSARASKRLGWVDHHGDFGAMPASASVAGHSTVSAPAGPTARTQHTDDGTFSTMSLFTWLGPRPGVGDDHK